MKQPQQPPQKPNPMNGNFFTLIIWFFIALLSVNLIKMAMSPQSAHEKIEFPQFIEKVKNKEITSITYEDNENITATFKDKKSGQEKTLITVGDKSDRYLDLFMENGLVPNYKESSKPSFLLTFFLSFGPVVLIILMFIYMARGRGGAGGITAFGRAKTKNLSESREAVRFADVAGVDESKEELQEIVEFLKNPQKFTKLGGKLPKGALLVGPPGTGKTMLAKAVATEAGVPFLSMSGSDFIEMFVGVGASRVRDLFEQARAKAPCIIFIDEIDAVGKARGGNSAIGGGHDERDQTLNQLLVEMDGFDSQSGIIILAATNRVDVLDPALLRPGRFDRRVVVQLPDVVGREKILNIHSKKTILDEQVNLKSIAKGTAGFSGADLANLINEAALFAARRNHEKIAQQDLEEARDKILMGPQRKSMQINPDDKKTTAYHEAGHAIIARVLNVDPVHKVTIIPRGMALGVTQTLPEDNVLSLSKEKAEKMISMLMGGRVAEEIIFNHYTTGASNDIERATQLARRMVTEWGMSSLGPINYKNEQSQMSLYADFSEATRKEVDDEIKKIIHSCYKKTQDILKANIEVLHNLSKALIEKETLDGVEVEALITNK
jgi:cell division protease FtsH